MLAGLEYRSSFSWEDLGRSILRTGLVTQSQRLGFIVSASSILITPGWYLGYSTFALTLPLTKGPTEIVLRWCLLAAINWRVGMSHHSHYSM